MAMQSTSSSAKNFDPFRSYLDTKMEIMVDELLSDPMAGMKAYNLWETPVLVSIAQPEIRPAERTQDRELIGANDWQLLESKVTCHDLTLKNRQLESKVRVFGKHVKDLQKQKLLVSMHKSSNKHCEMHMEMTDENLRLINMVSDLDLQNVKINLSQMQTKITAAGRQMKRLESIFSQLMRERDPHGAALQVSLRNPKGAINDFNICFVHVNKSITEICTYAHSIKDIIIGNVSVVNDYVEEILKANVIDLELHIGGVLERLFYFKHGIDLLGKVVGTEQTFEKFRQQIKGI